MKLHAIQIVADWGFAAFLPSADAFRKEQRKKEIQRNKLERKYTREAVSNRDNPDEIRKQLQEIIAAEEAGPLSKALKLRKKVLQEGFEHAVRKRKVRRLDTRVWVGELQLVA